ncbi:hypothetical protein Pmar_PMAR028303 [Perkinsus marinus ATCC 50983]|uniref:Uncharacterized protein n=1 Tax=Perkinsus marinus (strain ATCC 50983 / TXsc) TaxID=423536 RepID=C5LN52_PERM5|nr:hypothetical protein Pmar_PMAR028303 [Perkinsus marinus ATCC 50983]EER01851.1 hypothetical protein Pmar_PMAR028303 [Perkinsus marinus ATCC 50983]|eukprot:XP_002769133.1 hypothetical protein Pmar_PMAR028303 [Perkinsus marinus ATCC 50983]
MPPIRGQNVDGNGMNFMEVVFENMRDLGEPDVEIIRVNRILEENYFDTAESFATTTPDIWDALCLPRNVMEAVMREITMDNRGVDKEWERRRQEAARRGEEKRTVQLGEQAVSAGDGRGFDPGSAEKRIDSVEVVPYALKRLGDSHVSWVAVLQEAVQRLTNKNTAPGVGLFDWEYETRSAGVGGEKLEYRATVSFRVDIPEANGGVGYSNLLMKFIGCWHPTRKVSQREAARNAIETLKLNVDDLIARHGGDPNANILQSVHIRLQRYFGQRLHRAGATVMEWKHICSKIEEESPNGSAVKTEEFNSEGLGTAGVRPEDEIGLWQSTVTVPQLQKEFTSDWKNCKKDSQNDACFKLAAFLDSIGVPQANENPVEKKGLLDLQEDRTTEKERKIEDFRVEILREFR